MHHYPFHVGDYIRATAHLDIVEDCVYRRLIDLYMETERPIPNETQQVIRRLRLGSSGLILESILHEFFTLEADNCWHSSRCDSEIQAYKRLANTSRINGKLGGRPKKTQQVILDNPEITQKEPSGLQPRTKNQEPFIKYMPPIDEVLLADWMEVRKAKRAGKMTETAFKGLQREARLVGLTDEQAVKVCCERSWQSFKAEWYIKKPNSVHDARLDTARQIFGGLNGTQQKIIDITPRQAIEGSGEDISEAIPCLRQSDVS